MRLLCGLSCVACAAGLRAATKAAALADDSYIGGRAGEPLQATALRLGSLASAVALVVQLVLDWQAGYIADPVNRPEGRKTAAPTADGGEALTLREDGGVTKAVALYPALPTRLRDEPLPKFTMAEVAKHGTREDCWVILDGRAYDITRFIDKHPGGVGPIVNMAGKDATDVFDNYHAARVYKTMLAPVRPCRRANRRPRANCRPRATPPRLSAPPLLPLPSRSFPATSVRRWSAGACPSRTVAHPRTLRLPHLGSSSWARSQTSSSTRTSPTSGRRGKRCCGAGFSRRICATT